ncbi:hypothetical protein AB0B66_20740 [Catellatospora sp. NPDC049111]|uniref:effector-associated constant component EACC1 n=1 Tax=Catellatospora sp. NPDC049111 TaxID=3155271 RepID=UPI0033E3303F
MSDNEVEIVLVPADGDFDPTDVGWQRQTHALYQELREYVEVRTVTKPGQGQKGGVVEVIIALGASGAITAVLTVLRQWLNQRSSRSVTLTITGERPVTVTLDTVGASDESLQAAIVAAVEHAGNG